jgi:hypothetical protein
MLDEARLIAVDRLQPGDHACLPFSGDEERWQVLRAFAHHGFARGEKVMVIADETASAAGVPGRRLELRGREDTLRTLRMVGAGSVPSLLLRSSELRSSELRSSELRSSELRSSELRFSEPGGTA